MLTCSNEVEQPFARLAVEALDALAQLLDGFHQVVALGGERGVLGLDLLQFLVGAQVDRAEALALAPQPLQGRLDLGDVGQRLVGLHLGKFRDRRGLDLQHLANFVLDVRVAPLGRFEALLRARQFLARGTRRFQRRAGVAVGLRQRVLGLLQAVGAGAAFGFRLLDFADQRVALLRELLGRVLQLRPVAFGLGAALLQRGDLGGRTFLALLPAGTVVGERRQPAVGEFGFAHDRLLLGTHFGKLAALGRDVVAHGGHVGFELGGRRQLDEEALGFRLGGRRLVAIGSEPHARFRQRRDTCRVAVDVALGGFVGVARGIGLALALARGIARVGFRLARGFERALSGFHHAARGFGFGARNLQFGFDLGKPRALGQAPGSAGRRVRGGGKAVPAPQVAFARRPAAGPA